MTLGPRLTPFTLEQAQDHIVICASDKNGSEHRLVLHSSRNTKRVTGTYFDPTNGREVALQGEYAEGSLRVDAVMEEQARSFLSPIETHPR